MPLPRTTSHRDASGVADFSREHREPGQGRSDLCGYATRPARQQSSAPAWLPRPATGNEQFPAAQNFVGSLASTADLGK